MCDARGKTGPKKRMTLARHLTKVLEALGPRLYVGRMEYNRSIYFTARVICTVVLLTWNRSLPSYC